MHFVDGQRCWQLSTSPRLLSPRVVAVVLRDPRVRSCGDALIAGAASQSYELRE